MTSYSEMMNGGNDWIKQMWISVKIYNQELEVYQLSQLRL